MEQYSPKFELNQLVFIIYHKDGKKYPAKIVDIESCPEYARDRFGRFPHGITQENIKQTTTGRYGVQFLEINPTIINIPYFWEKEIVPMDD
jgi:hypothetical protein